MMEMMVKIELRNATLEGEVIRYEGQNAYVKVNNDILKFHKDELIHIEEDTQEREFEKALDQLGIKWEAYQEGENEYSYYIKGCTYEISVFLDFDYSYFSIETRHRGRQDEEWRNKKDYRKLDTLTRNVIKWAEK